MSTNGEEYNLEDIKIVGDGRGTMQCDFLLNHDRSTARAGSWSASRSGVSG